MTIEDELAQIAEDGEGQKKDKKSQGSKKGRKKKKFLEDEDDEIEKAIQRAEGNNSDDDALSNKPAAAAPKPNPLAGLMAAKQGKGGLGALGGGSDKDPNKLGENTAAGKMMSLLKKGMTKKFESLKDQLK